MAKAPFDYTGGAKKDYGSVLEREKWNKFMSAEKNVESLVDKFLNSHVERIMDEYQREQGGN